MMKLLGKPHNKWGWIRVAGSVALAAVAGWGLVAAGLRGIGAVAWLAWSGYQTFSPLTGVELAILPLLAVIIAGWLEAEEVQAQTDLNNHTETERTLTVQRKAMLKQFHDAVQTELAESTSDKPEIRAQVGARMIALTQTALAVLDGIGKGEALHYLFEKGLVSGESPVLALKGLDLNGLRLHKPHLDGICLAGAELVNAHLDGAHLAHSHLSAANLRRAFLRQADLRAATLTDANLARAHLDDANLAGADLSSACLDGVFLINTNLKNCTVGGSTNDILEILEQAILIETILPDGRKVTNAKGKEYLRKKEYDVLVNKL